MKYSIQLTHSERKEVTVFAADPGAAIDAALLTNPGFYTDTATELLDGDEPGEDFTIFAVCTSCEKRVWDEDGYQTDEGGCDFCDACVEAMQLNTQHEQS